MGAFLAVCLRGWKVLHHLFVALRHRFLYHYKQRHEARGQRFPHILPPYGHTVGLRLCAPYVYMERRHTHAVCADGYVAAVVPQLFRPHTAVVGGRIALRPGDNRFRLRVCRRKSVGRRGEASAALLRQVWHHRRQFRLLAARCRQLWRRVPVSGAGSLGARAGVCRWQPLLQGDGIVSNRLLHRAAAHVCPHRDAAAHAAQGGADGMLRRVAFVGGICVECCQRPPVGQRGPTVFSTLSAST